MKKTDWLRRYANLATFIAQWSKDPSTKVGAVLVGANRKQIAFGYNGFPPGLADTEERLQDRETKYRYVQHAERNALDNATFDAQGATLVVTLFPCTECAKSIITKGIKRVVCPPMPRREPWLTQATWSRSMFEEAGVELVVMEFV